MATAADTRTPEERAAALERIIGPALHELLPIGAQARATLAELHAHLREAWGVDALPNAPVGESTRNPEPTDA